VTAAARCIDPRIALGRRGRDVAVDLAAATRPATSTGSPKDGAAVGPAPTIATVLTAGLATRLRPLSLLRAKAALPVAGVTLVERILRSLARAGVADVVLNLHHLPHTLTTIAGDGSHLGLRVRYSWEVPVLGSAGGPARAIPLLDRPSSRGGPSPGSTFLIVNGDTLTDLDLAALLDDHRRSGALVTMAGVPNTEPEKYGGLRVTADGSFAGFVLRGSREPSFHFIGVQAAEPAAFASVPDGAAHDVRVLYPALAAARAGAVRVFRTRAEFFDIGTPADYLATSLRLAARENVDLAARSRIAPGARVEHTVLWDDVIVEEGAALRECVVTDGVRVPADTSWHGVTIRMASGELAPGERRIDELAIGSM
jgi:NDP-sugar pyrophosphorylase family protein